MEIKDVISDPFRFYDMMKEDGIDFNITEGASRIVMEPIKFNKVDYNAAYWSMVYKFDVSFDAAKTFIDAICLGGWDYGIKIMEQEGYV
jgi:hypothetical protein